MGLCNHASAVRFAVLALGSLILLTSSGRANAPVMPIVKVFPPELGSFKIVGSEQRILSTDGAVPLGDSSGQIEPAFAHQAEYSSTDGAILGISVYKLPSDSAAFAALTNWRNQRRPNGGLSPLSDVGTAGAIYANSVAFFKGQFFVSVATENSKEPFHTKDFAKLFAATLTAGEGDIPVLVRHLPDWERVQQDATYVVTQESLLNFLPNEPVLKEISFDGGTEAVTAAYDQSRLVIVEFTTPQFSVDNDRRIWTKISELKSQGQPTPTAYRRVGNYSVFVFNAPDEKTANALVDQVKYEQVVQWLGDDPHLSERLQRYFTQTSAGVLIAVLKSSGLSLLLCLAAGALIGTMLFRHRRAQRAAAYSDAGGSIRLNLDELTGPVNTRPLLSAKPPEQKSADS